MSRFDEEAKDWDTPESQERARIIAKAIRSNLQLSVNMTAFEYGCGTGQLTFELRDQIGPVTLADSSTGMLKVLKQKIEKQSARNLNPVQLDLTSDPLPETTFDLVFTMMTLHHIPDTEFILSQFYDLLSPKGTLCIVDLDKEDGSFHGEDFEEEVHHGFDRTELGNLAGKQGFKKIRFSTVYKMDREVNKDGKTKQFPIFLMVAQKS